MWVATAIIGSAVIGAGASIYGSSKAADAQTNAANASIANQQGMYNKTRADLAPYRDIGGVAATDLTNRLPELTAPITMDQATLEKTPGYQFNLYQGLKSTQNSAAARGLGSSGAALKGAAAFATGLADNTYQNQFNNANINNTNAYNRLKGLVDTGESAAAQTGVFGANTANQTSSALTQAGTAQAANYNAQGGVVSNAANNVGGYAMYKGLYGNSANNGVTNYSGVSPAQSSYWGSGNAGPI
jgi:hypothetical protein